MPAYVIVEVNILDQELYNEYKKLTPATIKEYGGKFIVRGPEIEILEGQWPEGRLVIIEFPSVEIAKDWWNSPGYTAAKTLRQRAAITNMIIVKGI